MFNMKLLDKREAQRYSNMRIRRLANNDRIFVNTDLQYKNYLTALRIDFEARMAEVPEALESGLKGFDVFGVIGTGAFGEVSIVRDEEGNVYAVKMMRKERVIQRDKITHVINEKRLLYSFRFPFVMWLMWARKDRESLYLGLPLLSGGELFNLHSKYERFTEEHARFYAVQVCLALEYLHFLRVVYRDLKLENIVMDKDGYIRLTDFGFSKRVEHRTMSLCGTPEYLAPEILTATPYFAGPDWWAFGVLIYEMVDGDTPFTNYLLDTKLMYSQIVRAEYNMPAKFTESLKDLIKRILVVDITRRLGCLHEGADDIKRHDWFQTVNWFSYLRKEIEPPFVPSIRDPLDTRHFVLPKKKNQKKFISQQPRSSYTAEFVEF